MICSLCDCGLRVVGADATDFRGVSELITSVKILPEENECEILYFQYSTRCMPVTIQWVDIDASLGMIYFN